MAAIRMNNKPTFLKSYRFSILLIASIAVGSLVGALMKSNAAVLKPLGDIFLNLLFTIVVPLVFFAISSTVAQMTDVKRLGKIMGWMVLIFVVTGIIAAAVMIVGVKFYPPAEGIRIAFNQPVQAEKVDIGEQIVRTLTVTDFTELFSKQNMFALILFAFLIIFAQSSAVAPFIYTLF